MLHSLVHPNSKSTEHLLRRRARNLRAKVKALLPILTCAKHDHRNRCVRQIEHHKQSCNENNNKLLWLVGQNRQEQFYCGEPGQFDRDERRFEKLSQNEIEQISEDRLYYLGEENLEDFQVFLSNRSTEKMQRTFCKNDLTKKADQSKVLSKFKSFQKAAFLRSKTQQSQYFPQRYTQQEKNEIAINKMKEFEYRRKILQTQSNSKRIMDKVKLNMKLERAQKKLQQIKIQNVMISQNRRFGKEEAMKKIVNKQKNKQSCGEIKLLQQQLRKTFLNRMSQTTHNF